MQVHKADSGAPESVSRRAPHGSELTTDEVDQVATATSTGIHRPPPLSPGAVRRLQRHVGNQALLQLWRQQPPRPTIQRQLASTEWYKFVASSPTHPVIAKYAANLGNDWDHATHIFNLGVHVTAESQDALAQLIAAGGGGKGPYTQLTKIATSALLLGKATELTTLLNAAKTNLAEVASLLAAVPAGSTLQQTTDLVSAVKKAKASVPDATTILKALPAGATCVQAVDLLAAVLKTSGTVAHVTALLKALPTTASMSDIVDLLTDVEDAKGTAAHAITFATAVAARGSIADARKLLVTAEGANRNVDQLTLLVNASQANTPLTDLCDFVAVAQLARANVNQMSSLLTDASRAGFTVKQVCGLLPAVQGIGGNLPDMKGLFSNLPKGAVSSDVDSLLAAVKTVKGRLGELINLAKAAPKAATIRQLSDFVVAFNAAGGTLQQATAFVQAVGKGATFAEQLALFNGQSPVSASDAISFLKAPLTVPAIPKVAASLAGVAHNDALRLVAALRADGLAEADLVSLMERLGREGKQGPQIEATLRTMRGSLGTADTSTLAAGGGTRILSGPQIHSLVTGLQAPGQNAPGYELRYPTGIVFDTFDVDTLFTHLDRDPIPALNGKAKVAETAEQIRARRALALGQLKRKANPEWADAVFNVYERSGKVFALPSLRDAIKPLCPALTAVQVSSMVNYLDGLSGDEVLELLAALKEGLSPAQVFQLLTALHSPPVSYTGTQIRDLIKRLRGNLAVVAGGTPQQLRSIVTALTKNANNTRNPASAGEQVLTSGELFTHLTTRIGGLQGGQPVPNLGSLYPTGQDYTTRTEDELWLDCSTQPIHQDVQTHQGETPQQVQMRRKLALQHLKTLPGLSAGLVQAVFDHDNGQSLRPFQSALIEDGYNLGGHTVVQHVLDPGGNYKNRRELAERVCTKQPACPERAGAFDSLFEANAAIRKVNTEMQATWTGNNGYRHQICSGVLPNFDIANTTGVLIEKRDEPKLNAYDPSVYKHRGLLPGPTVVNSLVIFVPPVNVHVAVGTYSGAPGGWHVITAYPTL